MSRQNRSTERDRKPEGAKRDVSYINDRNNRQSRESSRNESVRTGSGVTSGLDRHRLNDLYERSSV